MSVWFLVSFCFSILFKDFLDNYNELINDLDIKKINEAIKKYIKPENLTKSVAGSID